MKTNMKDMSIITVCPLCGAEFTIKVSTSDYIEWLEGTLVQDAFPYLSADEREALVSGICSKCWENMFSSSSDDEEEEEEDFEYDDCDFEIGFDPYLGCFSDDC